MGWTAILNLVLNCNIGVNNTTPLSMLHPGNCTVVNSAPVIVFGKNVNGTDFRHAFMGYTGTLFYYW